MGKNNYKKFYLMLLASSVIMYIVMYLNVNDIDHVYFSLTRLYMTVLMITVMAVVMLLMMHQMYNDKRKNVIILSVSIGIFILVLVGVHRQTFVGDRAYLKAMIPHHSIAIMTSENASLQDPEVRRLADSIISAQKREISQMQRILNRIK